MSRVDEIIIRQAITAELTDVAGLRWNWIQENDGVPVVTRGVFVASFVEWAKMHRSSHSCVVAVRGGTARAS